jgi:hypothetical protein
MEVSSQLQAPAALPPAKSRPGLPARSPSLYRLSYLTPDTAMAVINSDYKLKSVTEAEYCPVGLELAKSLPLLLPIRSCHYVSKEGTTWNPTLAN